MTREQLVWAALIVAQFVVVSPLVLHLFFRTKPMTIDVTALNASISTLSTLTAELSTQIGDPNADQAVVDGVTSSLAPVVSALSNLVATPVSSSLSDTAQ